jgi:hypothetical protein
MRKGASKGKCVYELFADNFAFAPRSPDVRVSVPSASLFPFDLLLVPFAMVCGIYGMPFVIPALALVESPRLALQVLVSTSVGTDTGRQNAHRGWNIRCYFIWL